MSRGSVNGKARYQIYVLEVKFIVSSITNRMNQEKGRKDEEQKRSFNYYTGLQ